MIILYVISLSTFKLIVDSYLTEDESSLSRFKTVNYYMIWLDISINFIFLIELMMRCIAKGFIIHSKSCMRDNWTKMDFLILIVSVLDNLS